MPFLVAVCIACALVWTALLACLFPVLMGWTASGQSGLTRILLYVVAHLATVLYLPIIGKQTDHIG